MHPNPSFRTVDEARALADAQARGFGILTVPGPDGILGAAENHFITPDNPFGIDANDPYSADDILIEDSEFYLPVGIPVNSCPMYQSRPTNRIITMSARRTRIFTTAA